MYHKLVSVLFLISVLFQPDSYSQSIWIPFKEKESWGIKDERGQVLFHPEFDSVYLNHPLYQYFDDQIMIIKNGKQGIVNLKKKFTIEPSYDRIYVNGGLDPGNNSTEEIRTASGFFHIDYNRISKYGSGSPEPFYQYELYFIILEKDNKYLILDNKFLPLLHDPVDDILINPDIFSEYGILILEDHGKSAILYQYGKKSTGFIFNSASFLLNEVPYFYNEKSFKMVIDGEIVQFKKNGRIINSEAGLSFPEYEFCIKGKQDTRSWIFDYTINNENLFISDGESNLYSFSDEKKCLWIREVPDLFHYKPVIADPYLAAGNAIFNMETDDSKAIHIIGKNLRCVQIENDYLLYIGDFDNTDILNLTEISGWYDLIESSGPSSARLICYDLKKESIIWNRPLPASSSQDLQAYKKEGQLVLSLSISEPVPKTLVFFINMKDGSEISRQVFVHPQKIYISQDDVFISDQCDPDYDLNCEELSVRLLDPKKSESVVLKMKIDYPDNLYFSNDFIFYLGKNNELEIRDIKSLKKKKSISLGWLGDYSENPVRETRMLQYTGGKLYFITGNQYLFSIDPHTYEIKSYGFYENDRWIKITEKIPVISVNKAVVMDEYGDLFVFRLF